MVDPSFPCQKVKWDQDSGSPRGASATDHAGGLASVLKQRNPIGQELIGGEGVAREQLDRMNAMIQSRRKWKLQVDRVQMNLGARARHCYIDSNPFLFFAQGESCFTRIWQRYGKRSSVL